MNEKETYTAFHVRGRLYTFGDARKMQTKEGVQSLMHVQNRRVLEVSKGSAPLHPITF